MVSSGDDDMDMDAISVLWFQVVVIRHQVEDGQQGPHAQSRAHIYWASCLADSCIWCSLKGCSCSLTICLGTFHRVCGGDLALQRFVSRHSGPRKSGIVLCV